MKYVGALPNYICHTLLLLNPTNLDEASVQVIHIENRGKYDKMKNHLSMDKSISKEKERIRGKLQQIRMIRKHSIALNVKIKGMMKSNV